METVEDRVADFIDDLYNPVSDSDASMSDREDMTST